MKCYPTYTIFSFLFTLTPYFILSQTKIIGQDYRYIAFYAFFYFICIVISARSLIKKSENGDMGPDEPERIEGLSRDLKILLVLVFIQNAIVYYLYFSSKHSVLMYMSACPMIMLIGLVSVYLTTRVYENSNVLFHVLDFLEPHILVLLLAGLGGYVYCYGVTLPKAIMLSYIPFYIYILKGLLLVSFYPSGMVDITERRKDNVICWTLTGKRYCGQPEAFHFSMILQLEDVEQSSFSGNWEEADDIFLLPFYIVYMARDN